MIINFIILLSVWWLSKGKKNLFIYFMLKACSIYLMRMRNSTVKKSFTSPQRNMVKIEKLQMQLVVWNVTDLSINTNSNYDKTHLDSPHDRFIIILEYLRVPVCFVLTFSNTNLIIIMFIWMNAQLWQGYCSVIVTRLIINIAKLCKFSKQIFLYLS